MTQLQKLTIKNGNKNGSDLINAGGEWIDEKCVVDGKMVTAQTPEDLPAFMKAILQLL